MHPRHRIHLALWLAIAGGVAGGIVVVLLWSGYVSQRLTVWHWKVTLAESTDENCELPLAELARCGPEGLQAVVAELDSPRWRRAAASEQALIELLYACEQLAPAQASAERLLLARSLAESMNRLGPSARRSAVDLAVRLLVSARREEKEVRTNLAIACEQVLRAARESRSSERKVRLADARLSDASTSGDRADVHIQATSRAQAFDSPTAATWEPPMDLAGGSVPVEPAAGLQSSEEKDVQNPPSLQAPDPLPPGTQTANSAPPFASAANLPAATEHRGKPRDLPVDDVSLAAGNRATAPLEPPAIGDVSTLDVIAQLRSGDFQRVAEAEQILKLRGLSPLELELARRLTDPDVQARERMAYALPSLAEVDARPWLAWLSQDRHPQVRRAAFSVMATVPDPLLRERITAAAQSDVDPEIRSLASELSGKR